MNKWNCFIKLGKDVSSREEKTNVVYRIDCIVNNTVNKWNCIIKFGKDVSSREEKTNVVYRIDCNECAATYVGQTERRLCIRVNEHKKKCKDKDRGSAIYTHMEESNHRFNFDNVKVLHTEQSLSKRKLTEMLFIHAQKHYINNQQDTKTLKFEYKTFINKNHFLQ